MAESSPPPDLADLRLQSRLVGAMPIVNHLIARLELDAALEEAVPHDDARLRLAPAKVLGVVVRNLCVRHGPVYAMGEWAATYEPELLGLEPEDVSALNDDRVGRMLARLFDADRASLLTGVVVHCGPSMSSSPSCTTTRRRSP